MALRVAVFLAALALLSAPASAQTPDNVLLVVNDNSPDSIRVAEHYASVRKIPGRNIAHIKTTTAENIARPDYIANVELPIATWLGKHLLQDQILYIVLTKGIPIRVDGTEGLSGTVASVDSELTLLYRKMLNITAPMVGRLDNPYYLGEQPLAKARRFTRESFDLYLVTRLDGFTADDVMKLIDRGAHPAREGQIVLDQKATVVDRGGDAWLAQAAARLAVMPPGTHVALETTRAVATSTGPVLGYFSWGSNDPANQLRQVGLPFANGAIGGMFVSTDARTFKEPPATWKPAIAGSLTGGQSLVGDLIREGITGVSGHVTEPFLDAIVRPQILFPAYVSGFNLAESFYLAMPFLSWQDLVIGDPLCAPFAAGPIPINQISKGIDAETALPAWFSERSLNVLRTSQLKLEALKLNLNAFSLIAQERPESEIEAMFVRATSVEPRLVSAQMWLALAFERRSEIDQAITRYRSVLVAEPNNSIALNNLAYLLADRKNAAAEALPIAEKAYRLAPAPTVADTLAWVHHKLGNDTAAAPLVEVAVKGSPNDIDVLIHAATIYAALGNLTTARTHLDSALKADPKAADRPDVKALIAKIGRSA